jgi:hypothetical protein
MNVCGRHPLTQEQKSVGLVASIIVFSMILGYEVGHWRGQRGSDRWHWDHPVVLIPDREVSRPLPRYGVRPDGRYFRVVGKSVQCLYMDFEFPKTSDQGIDDSPIVWRDCK